MIQALLPNILPAVTDVIGRFLPEDKEARAKAERQLEQQLATHLAKIDLAQLDINKTEAAHRSVFIGWSCGVALAWSYVVTPILTFVLAQTGYLVELPSMNLGEMMPVLMGMLGLGGLRTFEKFKKVSR